MTPDLPPDMTSASTFDITRHWNTVFMTPNRLVDPASWVRHIPFAFLLIELSRPAAIVELGVHTGNSFSAFCQAVHHVQTKSLCYGVDTFEGDDHAGRYGDHIFADIQAHIHENYREFAQLMRMTFDQAATRFSPGGIDLLHIDGLHTYEAVRRDYETWRPLLSAKGIVVLHDIHARHDDFGVWKLWEELKDQHPSFGFRHGHGLGVLAVGSDVPGDVLAFIDAVGNDPGLEDIFTWAGDRVFQILQVRLLAESNQAMSDRLQALEPHTANLEALRLEYDTHCANLEASRKELQNHCANLLNRESDLQARITEMESHLAQCRTENQHLLNSWSLKLMRPIHKLAEFFHRTRST